jgi:HEAT repeat protein
MVSIRKMFLPAIIAHCAQLCSLFCAETERVPNKTETPNRAVLVADENATRLELELAAAPKTIFGQAPDSWLIRLQRAASDRERLEALVCLGDFGPRAGQNREIVETLCRLLREEPPAAQPPKETPPSASVAAQEWNHPALKREVCRTLGRFGPSAGDAVQPLLSLWSEDATEDSVRGAALNALGRIAPVNVGVQRALLLALTKGGPHEMAAAVAAAPATLSDNRDVLIALANALRRSDGATARLAAEALQSLGVEGLTQLLDVVKRGRTAAVRAEAARVISPAVRLAVFHVRGDFGRRQAACATLREAWRRETCAETRLVLLEAWVALSPCDPNAAEAAAKDWLAAVQAPAPRPFTSFSAAAENAQGETAESTAQKHLQRLSALLSKIGPLVLPELLGDFRRRLPPVKTALLEICGRFGENRSDDDSQEAKKIFALAATLLAQQVTTETNPDVRAALLAVLAQWGVRAVAATETLLTWAQQADLPPDLRRTAILTAVNAARPPGSPRRKSPLEELPLARLTAILLSGKDAAQRADAAAALRLQADANEESRKTAVAALTKAIGDADVNVRAAAMHSLAWFGKDVLPAAPLLLERLQSSPGERLAAVTALAGSPESALDALPSLVGLFVGPAYDADENLRKTAAIALRLVGPDAVRPLNEALRDSDAAVRLRALSLLAEMGAIAAPAWEALLQAAQSPFDPEALLALTALGRIGILAEPAIPQLLKMLSRPYTAERRAALVGALGQICAVPETPNGDGKEVVSANLLRDVLRGLSPLLVDPEELVCRETLGAFVRIGQPAVPALKTLISLGGDEPPYWAVRALARLGAEPDLTLPLLAGLTRPSMMILERGTAVELFAGYAPKHVEVLPLLAQMIGDRDPLVAAVAARTITAFGRPGMPFLLRVAKGADAEARRHALAAADAWLQTNAYDKIRR